MAPWIVTIPMTDKTRKPLQPQGPWVTNPMIAATKVGGTDLLSKSFNLTQQQGQAVHVKVSR